MSSEYPILKGSKDQKEFSDLLKDETARGAVIVVAAYFDEYLRDLLIKHGGLSKRKVKRLNFAARIKLALTCQFVSVSEHDDLRAICKLRNDFAHDLRCRDFDAAKTDRVEKLKIWQKAMTFAVREYYAKNFSTPRQKLTYVAYVISCRLVNRNAGTIANNHDPEYYTSTNGIPDWPTVGDSLASEPI